MNEEWILVKDSLPVSIEGKHYSPDVLVYDPGSGQYVAYYDYSNKTWYYGASDAFETGVDGDNEIYISDPEDITHWKHLGNDPE